MPTWPATDLADMFSSDNPLCDAATISGVTVYGHFSKEYIEELGVSGDAPLFTCSSTDLAAIAPAVARNTAITIDTAYTVKNIKDDGAGLTVLILEET